MKFKKLLVIIFVFILFVILDSNIKSVKAFTPFKYSGDGYYVYDTKRCPKCHFTSSLSKDRSETVVRSAKCTTVGYKAERYQCHYSSYVADNCGTRFWVVTKTIPALGHDYKWVTTKSPTCTSAGLQKGTCQRSGCSSTDERKIEALGHDYKWVTTKNPTCTSTGTRKGTCQRSGCNATYEEKIAALGHDEYIEGHGAATCTEPGTNIWKCRNCGRKRTEKPGNAQGWQYPPLGHNFVNGVCTRCGEKQGTSGGGTHIHSMKDATCTEPAKCTSCGATSGSALGHNYVNGICTRCGEKESEETLAEWDLTGNGYVGGHTKATLKGDGTLEITCDSTGGDIYNYKKPNASDATSENICPITGRNRIKKVHFIGHVKNIGAYLFYYTTNLEEVIIDHPEDIEYIGEGAFFGCKQLKSFTMPTNMTAIGARAFCHCHDLKTLDMSECTKLVRIGHEAFRDCWSLNRVKLPEGLKVIGYEAFFNDIALQNVVIPSSVLAIGTYGVDNDERGIGTTADPNASNSSGRNNVFTVDFSRNTNQEDEYSSYINLLLAQREITNTTEVTNSTTAATALNQLLTETKVWYYSENNVMPTYKAQRASNEMIISALSWDISKNDDGRITATLDTNGKLTVTGTGDTKDYEEGESPWNNLREYIKTIEVKEGITTVGKYLFYYNQNATTITLPTTLTNIKDGAFFGCQNVTTITLPAGLEDIGWRAFAHCEELTSITLPANITKLHGESFRDCYSLKTVNAEGKITCIGDREFYNCPSLETIFILPLEIEEIGEEAFNVDFSDTTSYNDNTNYQTSYNNGNYKVLTIKYFANSVVVQSYKNNNTDNSNYDPAKRVFTAIPVYSIAVKDGCVIKYEETEEGVFYLDNQSIVLSVRYKDGNVDETVEINGTDRSIEYSKNQLTVGDNEITITYCDKTTTIHVNVSHGDLEHHAAVAATCQAAGNIEYWECTVCNKKFSDANGTTEVTDVTIPKTAHTWNDGDETTAATCTEAGVKTYTCTVCEETKDETIPALGHSLQHHEAVAATCQATGTIEYWECSRCYKKYSNANGTTEVTNVTLPKGEHNWLTDEITTPPTCLETGTRRVKCLVCGETKNETIPALGHNFVNGECTRCGESDGSSSEGLTVNPSTTSTYSVENGFIKMIQPKIALRKLLEGITTNAEEVSLYDGEDKVNENAVTLATGMTVKFKLGNETRSYVLVVAGDVNGDGEADFKDIVSMNKHRLSKTNLSGAYVLAGDVTGDGVTDFKDIVKVNKYRLNKISKF